MQTTNEHAFLTKHAAYFAELFQPDVYLVNMLPQCAVSPIELIKSKRRDINGRMPMCWNGKLAEEWYHLYCQAVLRISREQSSRAVVVEWLRENAWFMCEPCEDSGHEAANCQTAGNLRMYANKRMCEMCYDNVAWANDEPEPPRWCDLPLFDPFAGLV